MNKKTIAQEIIKLKNADLALRNQLIKEGKLNDGYNEKMAALHNENAERLDEIINLIGYPTIDKVGKEASEAAWLVIQHSIGKPTFMKKCLVLLENAANDGKVSRKNLAYLADRIAVFEGKLQLYGTQFDWDITGNLSPQPFDNLSKVNQRRTNVELNTLAEQTKIIRERAKKENQLPPVDFEKRKQEEMQWKRKVGWIEYKKMKYKYTIFYVNKVEQTIEFYEKAFGFQRKFVTPENDYGELATGETTIAFASIELGNSNFKKGFTKIENGTKPLGMEMAFVSENIEEDFQKALDAGAIEFEAISQKPWGQKVGYVRDMNGILIEICTPIKK